MNKHFLAGIYLCLTLTIPVLAQQPGSANDPPTKAEVMRFIDLMQMKVRVAQMFEGMKTQARIGAEQGFKSKVPNPTPEQLKKVDAVADEIFNGFPIDDIVDAIVPIYQKHLTKSDLDAIIAFYSSPAGQRFVKEAPAMMAEAMQAGGDIGRSRMKDVTERIQKRIGDLAKEGTPTQPTQAQPTQNKVPPK